jgi:signal transduction histidine kinase
MIRPQAVAAGLQLDWQDAPAGVHVLADRTKLEQVLLNLLTNAIKFTPAGGILAVDAEVGEERVRIDVRDTGIGIPPDQIDSIFEPFVQVGRSLSSGVEGAGLGLAISRELARAMDGDLTAASEPGRGSTFSLTMPRAPIAE